MEEVSIGIRAKTAKAIAIALLRTNSGPTYLGRWNLTLYDPRMPATGQPHHEVMELPWSEAQVAVRPYEKRIEEVTIKSLSTVLTDISSKGRQVHSVGVVGSPDRELDRIGNFHIRAHAAEGILFRRTLEVAATKHGLAWRGFSEKNIESQATTTLRRKPEQIKTVLTTIGQAAGKPWRIDERAAALAAWLMLRG